MKSGRCRLENRFNEYNIKYIFLKKREYFLLIKLYYVKIMISG